MILHLVHDEKIINRTIAIFEEVNPNQNIFVVFTRHQLKYVNKQENVILFKDFEKKYSSEDFYRDWETDRKSTRLNSSHSGESRMPSSA